MRNIGAKYFAAMMLLENASLKMILTGTPLHTAPKVSDRVRQLLITNWLIRPGHLILGTSPQHTPFSL